MQEDSVDEGKGDHKTDEVIATDLDNAKTGAVPCQKSGFDHFNIEETNPMKSGAMSEHLFQVICCPISLFFALNQIDESWKTAWLFFYFLLICILYILNVRAERRSS